MTWIRALNQAMERETKALKKGAGSWDGPRSGWDKWRWVGWVLQGLRGVGAQT